MHISIIRTRFGGFASRLPDVLPLALLLLAGCASDRGEPASTSLATVRPAKSRMDATNPPAVVFVEFIATPHDVVDRMLRMAKVTKSDVVYDLGCGDGRIVIAAAKKYGCRAVGYDLDLLRVEEAQRNAEQQGVGHLVTIEKQDVLNVDLREASVVTIYMGTEINARLIPQLRRLRPGARIVSHEFGLADLPPDKAVQMTSREDNRRHRIYLWRCPLPGGSK